MPMTNSGNPVEMSPDERLKEVATILARGYLRYKKRTACFAGAPAESSEEPDVHGAEPPSLACEESSPLAEKGLDSSANRSNHSQAR
jgi:hypothetical protein